MTLNIQNTMKPLIIKIYYKGQKFSDLFLKLFLCVGWFFFSLVTLNEYVFIIILFPLSLLFIYQWVPWDLPLFNIYKNFSIQFPASTRKPKLSFHLSSNNKQHKKLCLAGGREREILYEGITYLFPCLHCTLSLVAMNFLLSKYLGFLLCSWVQPLVFICIWVK